MKPLSLLPKYLLITAAVCAAAVILSRRSRFISCSARRWTERSRKARRSTRSGCWNGCRRMRRTTTKALADRLVQSIAQRPASRTSPGLLARAIELDGASLIVLLDESGAPTGAGRQRRLAPAGHPGRAWRDSGDQRAGRLPHDRARRRRVPRHRGAGLRCHHHQHGGQRIPRSAFRPADPVRPGGIRLGRSDCAGGNRQRGPRCSWSSRSARSATSAC